MNDTSASLTVTKSSGTIQNGFEPVREQFDAYLAEDSNYSAQIAVYWAGSQVIDLAGGPHLDRESITGVYSATKGVAALTVALLVQDGSLDLDARVGDYWPEFGAYGKHNITVRQLLSHQAGLPNARYGMGKADYLHSEKGAELLAKTRPLWHPGSMFGHHALTIGILMEELVRRVS